MLIVDSSGKRNIWNNYFVLVYPLKMLDYQFIIIIIYKLHVYRGSWTHGLIILREESTTSS